LKSSKKGSAMKNNDVVDVPSASAAIQHVSQTSGALQLAEMTDIVSQMAHDNAVALDVPAESVASMALELRLSEDQLDVLMLTASDDNAEFTVIEALLRSGYSTDVVYAAFYVVTELWGGVIPETHTQKTTQAEENVDLREEFGSLADLLASKSVQPKVVSNTTLGNRRILESRRNRFVAMMCQLFTDVRGFNQDVLEPDVLIAMFERLVEVGKESGFVPESLSTLQALPNIFLVAQERGLEDYDTIYHFVGGKR